MLHFAEKRDVTGSQNGMDTSQAFSQVSYRFLVPAWSGNQLLQDKYVYGRS